MIMVNVHFIPFANRDGFGLVSPLDTFDRGRVVNIAALQYLLQYFLSIAISITVFLYGHVLEE